ncbi:MAG: MarR family transcriptional regulator, partial [Clostridiaceae bacterium]
MENQKFEKMIYDLYWLHPLIKNKFVKPYGKEKKDTELTVYHMNILFMLNEMNELSISEVGKGLGVCKANTTPLIQKLIDRKFIERFTDEKDRRYTYVRLTDEGIRYLESEKQNVIEFLKKKVEGLGEEDLEK